MNRRSWIWFALYVVVLSAIVGGMVVVRDRTLAAFANNPTAQAQWQDWKAAAAKQATTGPVKRRVPKSNDPPALILMRDHFPQMLTGAVVFGSLLFAASAWLVNGAFFAAHRGKPPQP